MDKLVRRLGRKDPVHLAGRTGPFVLLSLLVLAFVPSLSAEISRGHPAKSVRFADSAAEHSIDLRALVISLLPPEAPVAPVPRAGYLAETGALPLRYGAARTWPAPLPTPEQPSASEAAASEALTAASVVPPASAHVATNGSAPVDTPASLTTTAASSSPRSRNTDSRSPSAQILLSAEFVLGQLPHLSAERGAIPTRFVPAVPATPAEATGPLAALQ
jgi:hypothetical protein